MKLRFDKNSLQIVRSAGDALLLGMIHEGGRIVLTPADRDQFPGHREWLATMKNARPIGGFSLLMKGGMVTGVFPLSSLNPGKDARLPSEWIDEILAQVPTSDSFTVYD